MEQNTCLELIDIITINIGIAVGISLPQILFSGMANIAHVTTSIEVRCADGFYGPDCLTQCSNFVSCADCGLSGFTGQFCQFSRCNPGFTGEQCENTNDCEGTHCNSGVCVDEINNFRCECNPGFTGDLCETNIDDCNGTNCNSGVCVDEIGGFRCDCDAGFTGDTCQNNGE